MAVDPFARLAEICREKEKKMHPDPTNNFLEREEYVEKKGKGPEFIYVPTEEGEEIFTKIEEEE